MDQDIQNCAEAVQRGDPDRFKSAMTAPPTERAHLFVLYAFNLEVARAPWVTAEPMIAEMRLQWWLDAIEEIYAGGDVRRHHVTTPLTRLVRETNLPRTLFDELITARRWDIYKEPHADLGAFRTYVSHTSANLLTLAVMATGGDASDALVDFGYGAGLARLFLAIPELENQQRYPLVDGRGDAVAALAGDALSALQKARRNLTLPKSARAALRAAWQADAVLKQAAAHPARVANGQLGQSDFRNSLRLLRLTWLNSY